MRVELNGFFVRPNGLLPITRLCISDPCIVECNGVVVAEAQCGVEINQRLGVSPKLRQGDAVLGAPLSKVRVLARNLGEFRLGFLISVFAPVDPRQLPPGQVIARVELHGVSQGVGGLPVVSQFERSAPETQPCLIK